MGISLENQNKHLLQYDMFLTHPSLYFILMNKGQTSIFFCQFAVLDSKILHKLYIFYMELEQR